MKSLTLNKRQRGITIVEFSIVATLFFIIIFAIIEFGRLMFTWHVLNETSRRTARLASVCQVTTAEQADILTAAIINDVPLPNFTANNIQIIYLDSSGEEITDSLTDESTFLTIRFVEARIIDYEINLIIPLATFGVDFSAPSFTTQLPRESLGVTRTGLSDC
ncbi:TadE/TadG family type IV pilus assembly protein [Photobacterium indicum]|uniref:TadZ/CpaE protein n=1 Tax=Photobacterium indicum TaxID=81447 RepID=A0A2T3L5X4_9GAMM|nr:TadE/TadG family type IV pilus assembly protein [Photobacterium indicum]PSV45307.1 TadZ/CpaE protein [Photobacterium indicum]